MPAAQKCYVANFYSTANIAPVISNIGKNGSHFSKENERSM